MTRSGLGRDVQPARGRDARGMVTAELAVATLAALALTLTLLFGVYLTVLQVRCIDVAAAVARQEARSDSSAARAAERQAPTGAVIRVQRSADLITVEVGLQARPLADFLPAVPLRARAAVVPEPSDGGS